MNVQKESQLGAHAIMWAVTNKRQEVEDLLKRNGFKPLMGGSFETFKPIALASWVRKALMTNSFRAEFIALMAQNPQWATSYMSMSGEFANVSGGVADTSLNLDNVLGGNTPKKSWFTGDKIESTLNTALQGFLALDKNKTDRELASASRDVAMYNASIGKDSEGKPKDDTKSNTALYVVLGVVGVALVGGLIYFATKKS